jgi:hypothetical protein
VPIYGAADPAPGSFVVASGGFSGSSVLWLTNSTTTYINLEGVGTVGPGYWALQPDHVASVGQGDSGGPVAQTVSLSDGSLAVMAGGVVTAIATDAQYRGACQGYQYDGRECSTLSFHVDIEPIMGHWGVTIGVTSPPV